MERAREIQITRIDSGESMRCDDVVAIEEPLQITIDGVPIAVVMRTVGDDEDLVLGFLITEGVLRSLSEVARIDLEQKENHALVFLGDDVEVDLNSLKRNLYSASSCGICGKASIEAVVQNADAIKSDFTVSQEVLLKAPDALREVQDVFDTTGGLHAAGLFNADGDLLALREDVGRHNAIDKVIGHALAGGLELSQCFLQVSGRVSFEVVQKALMVGIPLVAAISAPTSLAVKFAEESGVSLVGFMRGQRMNVYAGSQRVLS